MSVGASRWDITDRSLGRIQIFFFLNTRLSVQLLISVGEGHSFLQKMLWLTVEILLGLYFLTSVTLYPSTKIVILTCGTHPTPIGEIEAVVRSGRLAILFG